MFAYKAGCLIFGNLLDKMDHKLRIFKEVAFAKSFSRAAKKLYISQPAVSKTIKNLEDQYGRAFFERTANSIRLTADGEVFLAYSERILRLYDQLEDEFRDEKVFSSEIKIGASTTLANYILPRLLAIIQQDYPHLKIDLMIGNTLDIQQAVLKKEIHLGIVEGDNHSTRLRYKKFIRDELVLVSKNTAEEVNEISQEDFNCLPLIGREIGSGTREVIENYVFKKGLQIQEYCSVLGSTESMKNYLLSTRTYAFLSVYSVQQELADGRLQITDIEDWEMIRWFYFITRQGFRSKLTDKFQNLLFRAHNQKE